MGDFNAGTTIVSGTNVKADDLNRLIGDATIKVGAVTRDKIADAAVNLQKLDQEVLDYVQAVIKNIYPVGALYISADATNPSARFGGTWEQVKDVLIGACGDDNEVEDEIEIAYNNDRVLVKKYVNGATWYNIYTDGWCEQGGYIAQANFGVVLPIAFTNTDYFAAVSRENTWDAADELAVKNKTTSGFEVQGIGGSANVALCWEAKGYVDAATYTATKQKIKFYYVWKKTADDESE